MLPILNVANNKSKKYVVAFKGINFGEGHEEGEFSDTKNVSTDQYPCISQRRGRTVAGSYEKPTSIFSKEGGLLVIDGKKVMYDGKEVGFVTEGRKQLAAVGDCVIIFPDKKYYNVVDKYYAQMDIKITEEGGKTTFADSSVTIQTNYLRFSVGDAVTISGCTTHPENNKTVIVRKVADRTITVYENTFTAGVEEGSVTFTRDVPDLDFICESNNRLWGTKGNTIYASKYGDPINFQSFEGLSGDSYYIDVGSDGEFTGCIPFSSHICFFKENTLHKLYGNKPSNFQMVTSQVYGVQSGSERSMCTINETLFYKGVNGVYAYTGGVPECVSEKFGMRRFSNACASTDGSIYYICMRSGNEWHLFAYDVLRGLWMREDDLQCVDMAQHGGHVYLLSADGFLYRIDEDADTSETEWSVTFCPFNETVNERKGYSKYHLRLELAAGSWITVEQKRDIDTAWQEIYTAHSERARTISIPVLPARCDSVEIRLSGKGECLLRTFIREFFTGSDV